MQQDHAQLVLSILPKYSFLEIVWFTKGKNAIKMLDKYLDLKKWN